MPKIDAPRSRDVVEPKEYAERLAIHLLDLDRVDPMMRHRLLHGRLDLTKAIQVGKVPSDRVVEFTCGLLDAALAADIVQSEFRREGDQPARFYILFPGVGWRRLSPSTVMTMVHDGKASLDPDVFPSSYEKVDVVPLPITPVRMGS